MTWLVFGVSCLLVLAGAVSIISGAPIIQIERGWTEVIAGTVALSSGGVVFALAGILMRLESIRDALSVPPAATQVPATEEPAAAPAPDIPATPAGVVAAASQDPQETADLAEASHPAPSDSATGQGLWKRVKRPVETPSDAGALERGGFPDRLISVETPMPSPEPAPALPAPIAPAVEIGRMSEADNAAASEPSQLGWLERSLFKGRLPKAVPDERPSGLPQPTRADATGLSAQTAGLRTEPTLAAEPAHDGRERMSDPSDDHAEPAEAEAGVTVIGRYQAGVASYVMYSDGTIEVETEGGQSHRFASMEELKAFIASQDNVLS
ncbi:hypothetical protein [Lichenifustis flavocetrariae]|uniref:DUF308 domain-containing protein n=1 Tax=Lichenifustis flavocetrariae TaxID=2949735 RepID=A0AA41YUF4_9HYPH|nr:hypothetical protein [Lichenifustis flavocetrariae]MCW6507515.1 hypothetical protein [Lichenifustis flavocetrariae]